jgi:hypothetical protein
MLSLNDSSPDVALASDNSTLSMTAGGGCDTATPWFRTFFRQDGKK